MIESRYFALNSTGFWFLEVLYTTQHVDKHLFKNWHVSVKDQSKQRTKICEICNIIYMVMLYWNSYLQTYVSFLNVVYFKDLNIKFTNISFVRLIVFFHYWTICILSEYRILQCRHRILIRLFLQCLNYSFCSCSWIVVVMLYYGFVSLVSKRLNIVLILFLCVALTTSKENVSIGYIFLHFLRSTQ